MSKDPFMQCDVLAAIADVVLTDRHERDDGTVMVSTDGFAFQTDAFGVQLDSDNNVFVPAAIVDVLMQVDDVCLRSMVSGHATLFPRSAELSDASIEAMFNPFVKRPVQRRCAIPLDADVLIVDAEGEEVSRADFIARVRDDADKVTVEMIVEFKGYLVETHSFTPVLTIAEIAICAPPPPPPTPPPARRQPRLKRVLSSEQ
jgi:hypothetical protein